MSLAFMKCGQWVMPWLRSLIAILTVEVRVKFLDVVCGFCDREWHWDSFLS